MNARIRKNRCDICLRRRTPGKRSRFCDEHSEAYDRLHKRVGAAIDTIAWTADQVRLQNESKLKDLKDQLDRAREQNGALREKIERIRALIPARTIEYPGICEWGCGGKVAPPGLFCTKCLRWQP